MAAVPQFEPTFNDLISLRDALTSSLDDIIAMDKRLNNLQRATLPTSISIHAPRQQTFITSEIKTGIRCQSQDQTTTPRPPTSDSPRRFRMEDIEVDGVLRGKPDYALQGPMAAPPTTSETGHTQDFDSFVLPREFFYWHGHVIYDDNWEVFEHPSTSLCSMRDSRQQIEGFSNPTPALPPEFINPETHLWKYWSPSSADLPFNPFSANDFRVLGDFLVFPPKTDDGLGSVDPWDVSLNQDPPFYRAAFMTPPYNSGMPNARVILEDVEAIAKDHNRWKEGG